MIEHEGYNLGFDEALIPGSAEQVVDQGGHVADGYLAVLVAVGSLQVDGRRVAAEQIVDQCSHVVDSGMRTKVAVTLTLLAGMTKV